MAFARRWLLLLQTMLALALVGALCGTAAGTSSRSAVDETLYVYLGGNGTGSVSISPPGLSCTQSCRATVPQGTAVTITATAAAGSAVDTWSSGVCREQGANLSYTGTTCTVTMDSSKSVSVSFTKETLYLYFSGNGTGSVTSSPAGISCNANCKADYAKGTKVTLTAKADPGSALDSWSSGACAEQGSSQSYSGPACTLTLDSGKSVSVSFAKSTLYLYFSGDGAGKVTSSPPGISCTENCKGMFAKRTKVTLTAAPAGGSSIDSWSGNACEEQGSKLSYNGSTCTMTLDSDKSVSISFKKGAAAPPPAAAGPTIGSPTPPPPPRPGVAVDVASAGGTTLVKLPGRATFATLKGGAQVPVGSVVDATRGKMKLTSSGGSSVFSRGQFVVREPKVAGTRVTDVALSGGTFAGCPATKKTKRHTAGVAAAPKVIRQLFGSGKGHFRTSARFASATVRGTIWTVQDRCDGTLTRVTRGVVAVRDLKLKKTVIVTAGHSYLAKR